MFSHRLIGTTIAIRPEHKPKQEVLHGGLQTLYYDLVGMHKLTPKIQEVMKFQTWLIAKLILEEQIPGCMALFGPLKQILTDYNNFCRFAQL
jgi:hypothetical protein